nr:MAG TPA: Putative heavy-metal-binding protein [Caudoviricetes sp.]
MKKVLLLFALTIGFYSCKTALPEPKTLLLTTSYDAFQKSGIFVTESNSVNFEYTSLGNVSVSDYGGWVKKNKYKADDAPTSKVYNPQNDMYLGYEPADRGSSILSKSKYLFPNVGNSISLLITKIKDMGGNGIINLHISYSKESYYKSAAVVDVITVSGMVIKK